MSVMLIPVLLSVLQFETQRAHSHSEGPTFPTMLTAKQQQQQARTVMCVCVMHALGPVAGSRS